jgi:hypothetical protein
VNPLAVVTRLVAAAAHEVVTEYRRLDAPPPPPPEPARTEINCTSASTQTTWQPHPAQSREAAQKVIGFSKDGQ